MRRTGGCARRASMWSVGPFIEPSCSMGSMDIGGRGALERVLLGFTESRHEAQVTPDRMTFAQSAQACRTARENTGVGKADTGNRALCREGFNLGGVENSLHGPLSRDTRLDDASKPNRV